MEVSPSCHHNKEIPVLPGPIKRRQSLDDPSVGVLILKRPKAPGKRDLARLITEEELVHSEILLPVTINPPHDHT